MDISVEPTGISAFVTSNIGILIIGAVLNLAATSLVTFLSARQGVKAEISKHYKTRRWDKKNETYNGLFDDLYIYKKSVQDLVKILDKTKELSNLRDAGKSKEAKALVKADRKKILEDIDVMNSQIDDAFANIHKAISLGNFYLSSEVASKLDKFMNVDYGIIRDKSDTSTYLDIIIPFMKEHVERVQNIIDEVSELADKDLQP